MPQVADSTLYPELDPAIEAELEHYRALPSAPDSLQLRLALSIALAKIERRLAKLEHAQAALALDLGRAP